MEHAIHHTLSRFKVVRRVNKMTRAVRFGVQEKDCDPFFEGEYLFSSRSKDEATGVAKFLDLHPEVIYSESFA